MCFLCCKHFCRLYWIFSLSLCIFAWLLIISSLCLIMLYWIHSRMLKRNSQRVLHCLRTDFRREVSSSHYTLLWFSFVNVCSMCMCTTCMQCLQRLTESERCPDIGVRKGYGLPCCCKESNLSPLQDQHVLLTDEPPLQTHNLSLLGTMSHLV